MKLAFKALFAVTLFVLWVPAFLIGGWWILGPLVFGKLGLPTDYEMPFMGLMLLLCLFSYTIFLDFALWKVSR